MRGFPPEMSGFAPRENDFALERSRFPPGQNEFAPGRSRFALGENEFAPEESRFAPGENRSDSWEKWQQMAVLPGFLMQRRADIPHYVSQVQDLISDQGFTPSSVGRSSGGSTGGVATHRQRAGRFEFILFRVVQSFAGFRSRTGPTPLLLRPPQLGCDA
jgi:hypothetical protein